MSKFIKDHYSKLILAGLGITAGVFALKYLLSGPEKKVSTNDVAKHFAKRFSQKLSEEDSKSGNKEHKHDFTQLCHAIREACAPELEQAEKAYNEAMEKVKLSEITEDITRQYKAFLDEQEKIMTALMNEKDLTEEEKAGILREIQSGEYIDKLEQMGKISHPIMTQKKILTDILKEQEEYERKLAEENPDYSPEMIRQTSSGHIKEKHAVTQEMIGKAVDVHEAGEDENLASIRNRWTDAKSN